VSEQKFIRRMMKWSGTEFHDDAEWAEREILRLRAELAAERERVKSLEMALENDDGSIGQSRVAKLREALEEMMECHLHGDFKNGVTDATGTMDEGDYLAGCIYDHARAVLKETQS
jgi:hypothetical protein